MLALVLTSSYSLLIAHQQSEFSTSNLFPGMTPMGNSIMLNYSKRNNFSKPPRLSTEGLQRTVSDLSYELSKEILDTQLPPIPEVEDAECECCGMSEECSPEYIRRVKDKFFGKLICGLCAEAVKEESEKNGGKREEAFNTHTSFCVRFNKFGRTNPVLNQAQAMREILRRCTGPGGRARAKSISPKDQGTGRRGGIIRTSSCMPAITRDMTERTTVN